MRIAVVSDIHGNVAALDSVLAHIAHDTVDVVVNLGDVVSGGLWPRETLDRLIPLGLHTIRGNHERQLLTLPPEAMSTSDRYAAAQITAGQRAWLAALPERSWLGDEVLLVHGTPASDLEYFLDTVEETGARPATTADIVARAAGAPAPLTLCGHTHLARTVVLEDGRTIANPGSVGWPAYDDTEPYFHVMESGTPDARYAIADNASGEWRVELRSVQYDVESAYRRAMANDRPDIADALRTGTMR
ncbi:metallophosphoesterase family protein [Actinomycetes bacterium M1A6_2h]